MFLDWLDCYFVLGVLLGEDELFLEGAADGGAAAAVFDPKIFCRIPASTDPAGFGVIGVAPVEPMADLTDAGLRGIPPGWLKSIEGGAFRLSIGLRLPDTRLCNDGAGALA